MRQTCTEARTSLLAEDEDDDEEKGNSYRFYECSTAVGDASGEVIDDTACFLFRYVVSLPIQE